jgi:RNA polymerase sigma factor (sigma-70 family)
MEASALSAAALRGPRRASSGPRLPARMWRLAPDERLVAGVRAGSQAAFEAVFERYHRGLLAFCTHMLGSAEEAEDAVQQVFLSAFRGLMDSERRIELRPWLYAIARNRSLSLLRARRERPVQPDQEPATEHLSAEFQRREDLRALLADVARLPDDQRAALVLAEAAAMPHEEIARVLECPRDKVKALVFQARSSLIASRAAREAPCAEIREQLATQDGGSLRRTVIRRHLRDCAGCRGFREDVRRQRRMLSVALPVVPSLALKEGALAAVVGGGATAGVGGVAAGGSAGTLAAKALVVVALAGGGTAAGVDAVHRRDQAPTRVVSASAGQPAAAAQHPADRPAPAAAEVTVATRPERRRPRRDSRAVAQGVAAPAAEPRERTPSAGAKSVRTNVREHRVAVGTTERGRPERRRAVDHRSARHERAGQDHPRPARPEKAPKPVRPPTTKPNAPAQGKRTPSPAAPAPDPAAPPSAAGPGSGGGAADGSPPGSSAASPPQVSNHTPPRAF